MINHLDRSKLTRKELLVAINATLHSLSLQQLHAVKKEAGLIIDRRVKDARLERTVARLVPYEGPIGCGGISARKRFRGGFFVEKYSNGKMGKRLYAKTLSGILYAQNSACTAWEKVTWDSM